MTPASSAVADQLPVPTGLTLAEAEALASREGQVVRVLGEDGDCHDRTADHREDRVSLYLEDGDVVRARRF